MANVPKLGIASPGYGTILLICKIMSRIRQSLLCLLSLTENEKLKPQCQKKPADNAGLTVSKMLFVLTKPPGLTGKAGQIF